MASGGMGQYEVNLFILETLDHGCTLASIDIFARKVTWPKKVHPLSKGFFQARIVPTVAGKGLKHLKAFASECIVATRTCRILCAKWRLNKFCEIIHL